MFEGIITNILNKVLGEFLEGISSDQLSISLFSGDVELYNLAIKPNILDNMPLPFKLKYGKVGKVFVDVPVTGIMSQPLKIEISEIFMLVEPKEVGEWSEKVIEEAFISSVQSSLQNLEEYFKGQMEIQNSEPGMAANMVNKIIDNTQIDIRNVYFRFEDSVSNPKIPYSLGMCVEAIQLYTCNDKWERAFVAGKDISCKMAKITNFQMFLNFSDEENDMKETVKFDQLTEDMHIDEVEDPEIREIIKTRQESGVEPSPTVVRTKNFLLEEIKSKRSNRNLIEKFCIEGRIKLNKDPKKNGKPQLDVNLVIGGKYKEGKMEIEDSEDGIGFFKLQKQQMNCILKYLDYSTNYTKFQTGVQKKFLANKYSKEESKKYMGIYEEWKMCEGDDKSKSDQAKAKKLKEQMYEIEKGHTYEQSAAVRQIAINKYSLEFRKKQFREDMHKKIQQMEASKQDGYFSGLWGGRSEEQKDQDEEELQEYKRKLNQEFEDKFREEEKKVDQKMANMLTEDPAFDQDALQDMPKEWTMLIAAVVIPKLRFVLLSNQSRVKEEKSIMEMQSSGMRTKAKIGQDWQDIELAFGKLNIIDNITGSSVYQFLTETVFPGEGKKKEHKDSICIHFQNNPRFEDGELKLNLRGRAHQYIFVNMPLIEELQNFFVANENPEDEVDLSYYKDQAKTRALEYINQGADYLDEVNENVEYVHKGIDVDLELFAPILVIPESVTELTNKKTLVFNLGYIRITSNLRPYHKEVDYKMINRGEELYDQYDLNLNGFQLSMIEELVDYKSWDNSVRKIDIINQIAISLKANRSMEPNHPTFPSIELFMKIMDIDIYVSDYILANLMNIQAALLPPEESKVEELMQELEDKKNEGKEEQKSESESPKKWGLKKNPKGRTFEVDEEGYARESDNEENEGEENANADEEDEKSVSSNDPKHFSTKSKADVENRPGNKVEKKPEKSNKVDQRILIIFDKMSIRVGEVVPDEKLQKYEQMFNENVDIPHIDILELKMEGLEIEFNNGQSQNLNMIMTRLYIKDCQQVLDIKDGMECGVKPLVPKCFQKILSNPEIEKEIEENEENETSSDLRTVRTEDFKSIRGDEEMSGVLSEMPRSQITQFRLALLMYQDTISVEFVLANLEFIVTLPIAERLMKFTGKMQKLQEKDEETKVKEKINVINKFLQKADDESDSDDSSSPSKKKERDEKTKEFLLKNAKKIRERKNEEEKGYYQKYKEQRNEYLMMGKKKVLVNVEVESHMHAKGRLSNFSLKIPLDSMNESSRVLALSLSTRLGYKASTHIRNSINEITGETEKSLMLKNQQDANVIITQLEISMINQHLLKVGDEYSEEKLLLPSRIGIVYDKLFSEPKESDVTNIEMTIEPIEMKIGFRELDNFKELGETMLQFSQRISETDGTEVHERYEDGGEEDQKEKEKEKSGSTSLLAIGGDEKKEDDEDWEKKLNNPQDSQTLATTFQEDSHKLAQQLEENDQKKEKKPIKRRKNKQIVKMKVKLVSESINFSLMDDTGLHEYPLVNFNISKILANFETETGEDNAAAFILKKMGISEHPYMKLDSGLLLESRYFNIDTGYYEPLIEPWTFSAMVMQKTANSIMEVSLTSEEMLNMNLTYGMALAVKRVMTKLSQKTEEWENERANNESKMRSFNNTRKSSKRQTTNSKRKIRDGEDDEETVGFNFYNRLGLMLKICLENYETLKDQGIELEEEDKDIAVVEFSEWEDPSEKNFRSLKELNNILKYVKRKQHNGKLVENFEENIVRFDLYIEGFEPIMGVPIEIAGRRSYELYLPNETDKQRKKAKYQYSVIVNVKPEGKKKTVSFESQMTLVNKTEFDIEIAQVMTQGLEESSTQLSKQEIEKSLASVVSAAKKESAGDRYDDIELFDQISANQEFNVPLRWFLDEVAIFYK